MIKVYTLIRLTFLSGGVFIAVAGTSVSANNTSLVVQNDQDAQCEQPKERFIEIENSRVRYVEAGVGPAVVMIHGNAGSIEEFDFKTLGQLCRNHRVVAVDRPGHGKSDRPDGLAATLEFQTRLLHETLSQLGVAHPVLVGHSWGGSLALAYAEEYPQDVSAIVLLAPAAYPDGKEDAFLQAVLKAPLIGDVSLTLGRFILGKHVLRKELERAFYPQSVPEEYLRHASSLWLRHRQLRAFLEDEWSLNKDLKKMSEHYSEIRIPVVIVTGDHDKVVSAKDNAYRLKTSIAQSKLIELKNTGHQVPQTHPESIYNAVNLISTSASQGRASGDAVSLP